MIFVADESVDQPVVELLRLKGYFVISIAEIGSGMTDDAVLELANREKAVLITADKDFGEMIFRQRLHSQGVVLLRLAGMPPKRKASLVALAVGHHLAELQNSFSVIAAGSLRIRRLND